MTWLDVSRIAVCARAVLRVAAGLALAGSVAALATAEPANTAGLFKPNDPDVVALGEDVYAEHCAACHGARLEGQPDWRIRGNDGLLPAPPHDPSGHTWHHDDDTLFTLTKYGLAGLMASPPPSGMPAYEGVLSDDEIIAVLSFIKSTWPKDLQEYHDELNARTE
jgi:mono/diheme cytochrome c family protein